MNSIFKKIDSFLGKNGVDKLVHLNVCYAIAKIFMMYNYRILGISTAIIVALAKELYDKYVKKTTWDWYDIVADVNGILLAQL
jgi:uncharacterized protein YfiM (DUF2279 family)